ncbi:microtubule-associated protein [Carex rostrata]
MVVALGPGRFYGSGLPRPRYYPDPKLNSTRIDPPESMMDPFLSWANEAHWSMGGLSSRRLRLQGRIEGSITKLRKSMSPKKRKTSTRFTKQRLASLEEDDDEPETDEEVYDSDLEAEEVEEEEEEDDEEEEVSEEETEASSKKRKRARRLGDEFDRIAEEAKKGKGDKKVSKREKGQEKKVEKPRRVSPRKK